MVLGCATKLAFGDMLCTQPTISLHATASMLCPFTPQLLPLRGGAYALACALQAERRGGLGIE